MSIMSALAFVASGVTAKFVSPDVEATKLKAEVDDLKRQLHEARMEATDFRNEAARWQRLYEENLDPQERERRRQAELYQVMAAQQAMQAYPSCFIQNAQQNICHCVPGRHELLTARRL